MFNVNKASVIPNPIPICYENFNEYLKFRMAREKFDIPYFVLLAGGKGKGNEEAVKLTIKVFNKLPSKSFRLLITGPWYYMEKYIKNPSIKILGVVPSNYLKKIFCTMQIKIYKLSSFNIW